MARKVQGATAERVWYVPDVGDNREDPDPFMVLISAMSAADVQAMELGLTSMRGGPKTDPMARAHQAVKDSFARHVHEVKGYEIVNLRGEAVRPSTGAELYAAILDHGPASENAVLDDVYAAVRDMSRLRAGLPEVSRSRSACSSEQAPSPTPTCAPGAASAAVERIDPTSASAPTASASSSAGAIGS
jgi:hypothetical protein